MNYKIELNTFPNLKKLKMDSIKNKDYIAKFAKLSFDNLEGSVKLRQLNLH